MGRRGHCRREDGEWRQAACLLCTAMLVALIIVLIVLYFAVWKPRDPQLQLPTMQLLSLKTVRSGPGSTASDALAAAVRVENVSLNLQVVLYNPNRGVFWVSEGSGACLYYSNRQIGFTPIWSESVPAQSLGTSTVIVEAATPFIITTGASQPPPTNNPTSSSSPSYSSQLLPPPPPTASPAFQLTSAVTIVGHVSTANGLFSHHAYIISKCHITICFGDGSGLLAPFIHSYYCDRTYSESQ